MGDGRGRERVNEMSLPSTPSQWEGDVSQRPITLAVSLHFTR